LVKGKKVRELGSTVRFAILHAACLCLFTTAATARVLKWESASHPDIFASYQQGTANIAISSFQLSTSSDQHGGPLERLLKDRGSYATRDSFCIFDRYGAL